MNLRKINIFLVAVVTLVLFLTLSNINLYESVSISIFVYLLLEFINNLGKKIIILDIIILLTFFQLLLMPTLIYNVYDEESYMAKAFNYNMPVDAETYYSYAFWSTITLLIGLRMPLGIRSYADKNSSLYLQKAKKFIEGKGNIGLLLIVIGFSFGVLQRFMPVSVRYFFYIFSLLTYVGAFYILYSNYSNRKLILWITFALAFGQALLTGMFGEFVFLLMLTTILVMMGVKISFRSKLVFAFLGLVSILILQSIKKDYRRATWFGYSGYGSGMVTIFTNILAERLTEPETFIGDRQMFMTVVRFNQGLLLARTMAYVPRYTPYANGETILNSLAAANVPRLLWPDKPKAGGAENLRQFNGVTQILDYSMNIGPHGEAYANFGKTGGIIFMLFYGLFFNLVLRLFLKKAESRPTIIFWLPYLFLYSVAIETDMLMTVNSLVKATIVCAIVYWFFQRIYKIAI